MKQGPVEESVIAHILAGILGALEYLHAEDRIHRDLKAANVLISLTGAVKVSGSKSAIRERGGGGISHDKDRM